jgi:TonB family protein
MSPLSRATVVAALAALDVGCASPRATPSAPTAQPVAAASAAATPACGVQHADTAPLWREADVDRPVAALRSVAPTYPGSRAPGSVVMAFVVDTLGRVEPCSVRVVRTSGPEFAAAVAAALPQYQFRPAVRRGQRVRQFVQLPFTFDIRP